MIAQALGHRGGFALLPGSVSKKAARVAEVLDDIRRAPADTPVTDLLWRAWDGSPAATFWLEGASQGAPLPSAERALDAVVALFRQASDFVESQQGQTLSFSLMLLWVPRFPMMCSFLNPHGPVWWCPHRRELLVENSR